ncbi:MAG: DUF1997 domain-containing protein [Elainellaceae cyanobacterium]
MQANSADHQPHGNSKPLLGIASDFMQSDSSLILDSSEEAAHSTNDPMHFQGYFSSCMEMYASAAEVAGYLDSHRDWFNRCALPMKAEPIGENGYALIIGRFGSFGYEVEPKIGLNLLPQDEGVYRIQTIPIPGYEPPGYDVNFQAALELLEIDVASLSKSDQKALVSVPQSGCLTKVEWELHLTVHITFPRFIHALPKSLIQKTGDRLLNQIVRQVSKRLTSKVQDDFHSTQGLSFPHKTHKKMNWRRKQNAPESVTNFESERLSD